MGDTPPSAAMSFDLRFMQRGRHSILLALPEAYHASIGLVIAHWGLFEMNFDVCLHALLDAEKADGGVRNSPERSFKSRRRLFKAVCAEWLAPWRPEQAGQLAEIADTAGDLSWKRNMIAHGAYTYSIPPHSSDAILCRAVDGRGTEFPFDEEVLKKLYHDISHLTADLVLVFKNFAEIEGAPAMIPDAEFLRVYRETPHPLNPNPKKRTSPQTEKAGQNAGEPESDHPSARNL